MAKKAKKPISKPKKKGSSKKKKSKNIFTKIIVIIFVVILAFFMIFSLFKPSGKKNIEKPATKQVKTEVKKDTKTVNDNKTEKVEQKEEKPNKKEEKKIAETKAVEKSIKGTWQSTTGGAFLTMDGQRYQLDFMGVDSDKQIIGTYSVDGDLITFVNKKDPCKDVKGLYEVKFNKNEIGFKCKSDDCTKRKATLPTEWEWLDTEEQLLLEPLFLLEKRGVNVHHDSNEHESQT